MAFTATIPAIGAITISPAVAVINEPITIAVTVTEVSAQVEYVWSYSNTLYSGEEVYPWP